MMNWKLLLERWSIELMATSLASRIDPPPAQRDWLGFEPATDEQISGLETRLGVLLPPSYKSFLHVTDGWRRTNPFIGRIRPAAEVDWFRVENERWVEIYSGSDWEIPDEEYFTYPESGGASGQHDEHMAGLLQISDVEDGVYVLNSEVVTEDGEWEAWFFASWIPGAQRYPSFGHLMVDQYEGFRRLENINTQYDRPKLSSPSVGDVRVPAERIRSKTAKAKSIDNLLLDIQADDPNSRSRSIRIFTGKLKGRPNASRRPDLVQPLTELFYRSPHADVRSACIAALTEFAELSDAPSPLLDALSDPDPGVALQGMFALTYFPNRAAVAPLCQFIDSRKNVLFNETAMSQLGQYGDLQAIPTLLGVLYETDTTFSQSIGSAGFALGLCGHEGVEALIAALKHSDACVRLAAVVGIDISGDERATALLDSMINDPDEAVRRRVKQRLGKLP